MVCYDGRLYLRYRSSIGRARMYVIMNALTKSCLLDNVDIMGIDNHDNIFKPKNRYEKIFWESSRKIMKKQAIKLYTQIKCGKLGGRPKKELAKEKETCIIDNE